MMILSSDQRQLLKSAFRPHAPIEDPDAFVGRKHERDRAVDAIEQPGLQVLIYGERGSGKTSLANIATAGKKRVQVFCEKDSSFATICRDIVLQYMKLDPAHVRYDATTGSILVTGTQFPATELTGNMLVSILPNEELCVVLDELDRVIDRDAIERLAELAKNVSTYSTHLTFLLVGVADTADTLLAGHASNFRNLRQISLSRMSAAELREIIAHGETVLKL